MTAPIQYVCDFERHCSAVIVKLSPEAADIRICGLLQDCKFWVIGNYLKICLILEASDEVVGKAAIRRLKWMKEVIFHRVYSLIGVCEFNKVFLPCCIAIISNLIEYDLKPSFMLSSSKHLRNFTRSSSHVDNIVMQFFLRMMNNYITGFLKLI